MLNQDKGGSKGTNEASNLPNLLQVRVLNGEFIQNIEAYVIVQVGDLRKETKVLIE